MLYILKTRYADAGIGLSFSASALLETLSSDTILLMLETSSDFSRLMNPTGVISLPFIALTPFLIKLELYFLIALVLRSPLLGSTIAYIDLISSKKLPEPIWSTTFSLPLRFPKGSSSSWSLKLLLLKLMPLSSEIFSFLIDVYLSSSASWSSWEHSSIWLDIS